jgi:DNA-directed RNA polymerase specialized sigma subunit
MSDTDIPIEDKINALKGALRWREEVLVLRAENDRLREALKDDDEWRESLQKEFARAEHHKQIATDLRSDNDRLREALLAAAPLVDACSRKVHISKKWSNDVREQIDAVLKEAGQ